MTNTNIQDKVIKRLENSYSLYEQRGRHETVTINIINDIKHFLRLETLDEFYQEIDKEFKSYKIDVKMGKILQKLKSKPEEKK